MHNSEQKRATQYPTPPYLSPREGARLGCCAGGCAFQDKPWHDDLLALEGNAALLGHLVADLNEGVVACWADDDWSCADWADDIAAFIDEHSWDDQAGMHYLAQRIVRWDAWNHRGGRQLGVARSRAMRWRKKKLDEMMERLGQLGVTGQCPVCGSGTMMVLNRPLEIEIGGSYRGEVKTGVQDPEANVFFYVGIECDLCGNARFFNSERLMPSSERNLIVGMTPEEEAAAESKGEFN